MTRLLDVPASVDLDTLVASSGVAILDDPRPRGRRRLPYARIQREPGLVPEQLLQVQHQVRPLLRGPWRKPHDHRWLILAAAVAATAALATALAALPGR